VFTANTNETGLSGLGLHHLSDVIIWHSQWQQSEASCNL